MKMIEEVWEKLRGDGTQEFTACIAYHKKFLWIFPYVDREWVSYWEYEKTKHYVMSADDSVIYNIAKFDTKEYALGKLKYILEIERQVKKIDETHNKIISNKVVISNKL